MVATPALQQRGVVAEPPRLGVGDIAAIRKPLAKLICIHFGCTQHGGHTGQQPTNGVLTQDERSSLLCPIGTRPAAMCRACSALVACRPISST